MSDLLGNTGTAAPAAPTPAPTTAQGTGAGTSGTFPQGSTTGSSPLDSYMAAAQQIQGGLTPGTFASDYGVSSTEMPTFLDSSGKLNDAATAWIAYHLMSVTDRQDLQDTLVTAGLMKSSDVNGIIGTASNDAFRSLVSTAASQGVTADYLLNQVNQGGLGAIQQQLQGQATAAQAALDKQTPVTVSETNPTTLDAGLVNAFDQALGYAASPAQQAAFVAAFHQQEANYQTSANTTNRAQAQQDLTRAQSEESALNKLGPDGIDAFLQAYQSAIHGGGVAGAGTPEGPVTGAQPPQNSNPAGVVAGPMGFETRTSMEPRSFLGSVAGMFVPGMGQMHQVSTTTPTGGTLQTPTSPVGTPGTVALHGGLFALTPALWQEAVKLTPAAKPYSTAGAAPTSIQQAAVTNLASSLYGQYGSWSSVAIVLAGGKPGQTSGKAEGTTTNIQTFAQQVASSVNNQIEQLQQQVNAPGPQITEKVTAPDAAAEESLAAKNSDPIGYTAANISSWAGTLSKMLYGPPSTAINTTSDTFTGPVTPPGVAAAMSGTAA